MHALKKIGFVACFKTQNFYPSSSILLLVRASHPSYLKVLSSQKLPLFPQGQLQRVFNAIKNLKSFGASALKKERKRKEV